MTAGRVFAISMFLCFNLFSGSALSQSLRVAVASNFYYPLQTLLQGSAFESKVILSSGASGLLYSQILRGAPFDVFLSADGVRPQLLFEQKLAKVPQVYAKGRLVLWPAQELNSTLKDFKGKLAIANPQIAPYGAAALNVVNRLQMDTRAVTLLRANNVNQAFQFVDSGNAKLGLLAKSQLVQAQRRLTSAENKQKYQVYAEVPRSWHQPLEQRLAVLTGANNLALAEAFSTWLLSEPVQQKLRQLGYDNNE